MGNSILNYLRNYLNVLFSDKIILLFLNLHKIMSKNIFNPKGFYIDIFLKLTFILQSLGAPKFVSRKDLFDETYGLLNQVIFYTFLQRAYP